MNKQSNRLQSLAPRSPHGRAGFSLVELAVATVALVLVLGGVTQITISSKNTFDESITKGQVTSQTRRILDRVMRAVQSASSSALQPQALTPDHTESLTFQINEGYVDGIQWSPNIRISLDYAPGEFNNGIDDNGNGLIDDCQLFWTEDPGGPNEKILILASGITEYLEGEIPDGADDENGNGLVDERGFSCDLDNQELTVRLTMARINADGDLVTSTAESSAFLKN